MSNPTNTPNLTLIGDDPSNFPLTIKDKLGNRIAWIDDQGLPQGNLSQGSGGISTVTTNSTLSGNGSVASPLGVLRIPNIVTNGLLAEYPFTDGSGTILTDISGLGNNGTLNGSLTW